MNRFKRRKKKIILLLNYIIILLNSQSMIMINLRNYEYLCDCMYTLAQILIDFENISRVLKVDLGSYAIGTH